MALITDRDSLKTAMTTWLYGRTDLVPLYDQFIAGLEQRVHYGSLIPAPIDPLRVREMEATEALTPADGVVTIPDDFLEVISVCEASNPKRELEYASRTWSSQAYPSGEGSGASFYTITGGELKTFPFATSSVDLTYYQKIPALTEDNTSNWLLEKAPNVYLYGSVLEAVMMDGDAARQTEMIALLASAMSGLTRSDQWSRQGIPSKRSTGYHP